MQKSILMRYVGENDKQFQKDLLSALENGLPNASLRIRVLILRCYFQCQDASKVLENLQNLCNYQTFNVTLTSKDILYLYKETYRTGSVISDCHSNLGSNSIPLTYDEFETASVDSTSPLKRKLDGNDKEISPNKKAKINGLRSNTDTSSIPSVVQSNVIDSTIQSEVSNPNTVISTLNTEAINPNEDHDNQEELNSGTSDFKEIGFNFEGFRPSDRIKIRKQNFITLVKYFKKIFHENTFFQNEAKVLLKYTSQHPIYKLEERLCSNFCKFDTIKNNLDLSFYQKMYKTFLICEEIRIGTIEYSKNKQITLKQIPKPTESDISDYSNCSSNLSFNNGENDLSDSSISAPNINGKDNINISNSNINLPNFTTLKHLKDVNGISEDSVPKDDGSCELLISDVRSLSHQKESTVEAPSEPCTQNDEDQNIGEPDVHRTKLCSVEINQEDVDDVEFIEEKVDLEAQINLINQEVEEFMARQRKRYDTFKKSRQLLYQKEMAQKLKYIKKLDTGESEDSDIALKRKKEARRAKKEMKALKVHIQNQMKNLENQISRDINKFRKLQRKKKQMFNSRLKEDGFNILESESDSSIDSDSDLEDYEKELIVKLKKEEKPDEEPEKELIVKLKKEEKRYEEQESYDSSTSIFQKEVMVKTSHKKSSSDFGTHKSNLSPSDFEDSSSNFPWPSSNNEKNTDNDNPRNFTSFNSNSSANLTYTRDFNNTLENNPQKIVSNVPSFLQNITETSPSNSHKSNTNKDPSSTFKNRNNMNAMKVISPTSRFKKALPSIFSENQITSQKRVPIRMPLNIIDDELPKPTPLIGHSDSTPNSRDKVYCCKICKYTTITSSKFKDHCKQHAKSAAPPISSTPYAKSISTSPNKNMLRIIDDDSNDSGNNILSPTRSSAPISPISNAGLGDTEISNQSHSPKQNVYKDSAEEFEAVLLSKKNKIRNSTDPKHVQLSKSKMLTFI